MTEVNLLNMLTEINWLEVIAALLLLSAFVVAIITLFTKVLAYLGKPVQWFKRNDEDHELLLKTNEALEQLQLKQEEDTKNSIKHDIEIKDEVKKLSDSIATILSMIDEMQKKEDAVQKSKLKDRIGESYRFYSERRFSDDEPGPYITSMEKEALKDLIISYEHAGGMNSFVHSKVEPEMETWKVVE